MYHVQILQMEFFWKKPLAFQVILNVQYTGVNASFEVFHLDTVLETDFF